MLKKLLFFLFTIFMSINMMATEVAILPSDFTPTEAADYSLTKDSVTIEVAASTVTAEQMRIFKGKTITISSPKDITSIVFTCTSNGTAKYGPGCFAEQEGYTFEENGKTGTWLGNAKSVTFTASSNQVRATHILIMLNDSVIPTPQDTTSQDTTSQDTIVPTDAIILPGIEATMVLGTKSYEVTVNGRPAIRVGTGKDVGTMTIQIPANANKLHFFAAAWKGEEGALGIVPPEGVTISTTDSILLADDGISGTGSDFTLQTVQESECIFNLDLFNVNTDTEITFTRTGGKKRFVIWGATYETASTPTDLTNAEANKKSYKMFDGKQVIIVRGDKKFNILGQEL